GDAAGPVGGGPAIAGWGHHIDLDLAHLGQLPGDLVGLGGGEFRLQAAAAAFHGEDAVLDRAPAPVGDAADHGVDVGPLDRIALAAVRQADGLAEVAVGRV